jgi:UDP-N-acetylglucosamine 4,6-dehydratase
VVGSRGSVVPLYLSLKEQGKKVFPITHEEMTRFWITLERGVELVIAAIKESEGGEVFVPRIPSMKVTDMARAIDPECDFKMIGVRPGERIHEVLVSEEEARHTRSYNGMFVILPQFYDTDSMYDKYGNVNAFDPGFAYRSNTNSEWLSSEQLRSMIEEQTF